MQVANTTIQSIAVLDDDPSSRRAAKFSIEELGVKAILEAGPYNDFRAVDEMTKAADAAICDHHLRKNSYAVFDGAAAVAFCYQKRFPALLSTNWEGPQILGIRQFRRQIPVLLRPADIEPASITHGFEKCIREFQGSFDPDRKPWRTLVRIEDVDADVSQLYVIVPAWNPDQPIHLSYVSVPPEVRSATVGSRFHAQVNLGSERPEDLYLDGWETS